MRDYDLQPCPFCGSRLAVRRTSHRRGPDRKPGTQHYVRCLHCGAQGGPADSLEEAMRNWNRRPGGLE